VLDAHIAVDLDVMDHLVGLVEAVLLRHLLQHLLVLLQVLQWDVLLAELRKQANLRLHLDETAVVHQHVIRLAVLHELTEDELTLLLMRLDVALDQLDVLRLHAGFHYRPQLLLVDQLETLIAVFDDGDLCRRVLVYLEGFILLFVFLIAVEGVVFGAIIQVVVTETVFVTRHDGLEVFDVVVLVLAEVWKRGWSELSRVHEEIRNLLAELRSDGDLRYSIDLSLIKNLSLSSLKEA
jgi:hypothetical protein